MTSRCVLFFLLAGSGLGQDAARMDQAVQPYVANLQFMGTAFVARGSQVLFSKGYGFANVEWEIPNAPNTKFRLGSVTKQFTAASILLLEERGKLNVSDPVKKYLPDAPAAWDKITIFHVLTHTSGIPNMTAFPDYVKFKPFATTPAELVARFRDKPLDFEPGEKWNYSNSGYVLLTYLIEKITGDTYEKFIRENIFTPLGMKDSGYDSNSIATPRRASGYVSGKTGFENASFIHMTVPQGAGALYSTTEDLLKWEQGLFGGKVLQMASLSKMTTPFKNNYAFGLSVDTDGGRRVILHPGGIDGFAAVLAYYPEDKLTVAVLGNVAGAAPTSIALQLAALAHGDNGEAKRLADADAAVAKRFKEQTAAPGSEAALHKLIEDVRRGKPDYDTMSPNLADATREQLPQLQATLTRLGAVQSVTFMGGALEVRGEALLSADFLRYLQVGADIYRVKFENGSLQYRIQLAPGGKIESASVRSLP